MAFILLLKRLPARLSCGPEKINLSEAVPAPAATAVRRPAHRKRCGWTLQFKSILTLFGVFPAW